MAKPKTKELRKGEVVHASEDLPGVPAGTRGKVSFVSGLSWTRYRVEFDNGASLGSLDRRFLARPEEWSARTTAG
ncbi:MAG TPA: hypothetical protein VGQ20_09265 [Acidimicrobiales bacterium]|jgi:hypothetical protein|nr:hypothetical protein [Acidimicrobiales bacterium]